jgi:hypothetical protein
VQPEHPQEVRLTLRPLARDSLPKVRLRRALKQMRLVVGSRCGSIERKRNSTAHTYESGTAQRTYNRQGGWQIDFFQTWICRGGRVRPSRPSPFRNRTSVMCRKRKPVSQLEQMGPSGIEFVPFPNHETLQAGSWAMYRRDSHEPTVFGVPGDREGSQYDLGKRFCERKSAGRGPRGSTRGQRIGP